MKPKRILYLCTHILHWTDNHCIFHKMCALRECMFWSAGLMDKALASGARDSRFESWVDQSFKHEHACHYISEGRGCAPKGEGEINQLTWQRYNPSPQNQRNNKQP